jgi:quercetin dioxygenase-like cupin family protein/DNA-binding Xre family transcriptional regulator
VTRTQTQTAVSTDELALQAPSAIGSRIRQLRRGRRWTLKKLSEASQIPLSTLSKVETGGISLNIEKLLKVCSALDVDVMQLVAPVEGPAVNVMPTAAPVVTGRRSVTRKGQARRVETDKTVYEHHASDFLNRKLMPAVLEVKAGHTPELIRHQGEEFIYVLEGTIEFISEFYEPTVLKAGESIYIDSSMAHNVRALGNKPARVLNIMTSPEGKR